MTDEHLIRHWTDAHNEFSGDLDRGLLRLGSLLGRRLRNHQAIGTAYASADSTARPASPVTSSVARATLAGLFACIATSALLVSVALFATSGTSARAQMQTADTISPPIMLHTMLA